MSNTETIKIQNGCEIEVTPPDVDNEIRMDIDPNIENVATSVYLTKEQAQQLIDTLQAFIS